MKKYFFFSLLFLFGMTAFAQTSLHGKVTDVDTGEELIGANITISQNGNFVTGTSTDFDGHYKVNLEAGTYDVEATYVGFLPNKITGVIVKAEQDNHLYITLGDGEVSFSICTVRGYVPSLIYNKKMTSGMTLYQHHIELRSNKNINALAGNAPGISLSQ